MFCPFHGQKLTSASQSLCILNCYLLGRGKAILGTSMKQASGSCLLFSSSSPSIWALKLAHSYFWKALWIEPLKNTTHSPITVTDPLYPQGKRLREVTCQGNSLHVTSGFTMLSMNQWAYDLCCNPLYQANAQGRVLILLTPRMSSSFVLPCHLWECTLQLIFSIVSLLPEFL